MKTISVTLDEDLLQGVDRAARAARTTRSELFRVALREWLAARRRRRLAEEDRAGYERRPVTADEFSGLIASQPLDDGDWS
ncbi:MAG: ribbon-helix-helix protein, CopG family [Acidobacteriota bacterium]